MSDHDAPERKLSMQDLLLQSCSPSSEELEKPAVLLPLLVPSVGTPNAAAPPMHLFPRPINRPGTDSRRVAFTIQGEQWVSTTHLFPAAYPRSHPNATSPPCIPIPEPQPLPRGADAAKEVERKRRPADLKEWDRRCDASPWHSFFPTTDPTHAQRSAERLRDDQAPQLWGCVERIVPLRGADEEEEITAHGTSGITLVLAHANGFHKEIWEPTIEAALKALASKDPAEGAPRIDEIWSIDTIDSGDAGAINRHVLGDARSWFDHSRDIKQLLLHHLPSPRRVVSTMDTTHFKHRQAGRPRAASAADMGPSWPTATLPRTRVGEGVAGRRLVGIGHSYSGAGMAVLANSEPDLFETIVLIDPVIVPPKALEMMHTPHNTPLSVGAILRKDVWDSRPAAKESFASKPFFQSWDPQVLALHLRFGLRPLTTSSGIPLPLADAFTSFDAAAAAEPQAWDASPQTLCMSRWSEASAFAGAWMSLWAWAGLESGAHKGRTHIVTMRSTHLYPSEEAAEALRSATGRRRKDASVKAKNTGAVLEGAHLVVQEYPEELGQHLAEVLTEQFGEEHRPSIPRPRL